MARERTVRAAGTGAVSGRRRAVSMQRGWHPVGVAVPVEEERHIRHLGRTGVIEMKKFTATCRHEDARTNPMYGAEARRSEETRPTGRVGQCKRELAQVDHS